MTQPSGLKVADSSIVYKLEEAIYRLKQAPHAWFERLASTLVRFVFTPSKCDPSLFIQTTFSHVTYILMYVDDILIIGSSAAYISILKQCLHGQFALKDLRVLHYFLGVEVSQPSKGVYHFSRHKYVQDLLKNVGMLTTKGMPTLVVTTTKLTKNGTNKYVNPQFY